MRGQGDIERDGGGDRQKWGDCVGGVGGLGGRVVSGYEQIFYRLISQSGTVQEVIGT